MSIECPNCSSLLEEVHDTTYSNYDSHRCHSGDHTGDIYLCEDCDELWIDDFLSGYIEKWSY